MTTHRLDFWRLRIVAHDRGIAATFSVRGGWFIARPLLPKS